MAKTSLQNQQLQRRSHRTRVVLAKHQDLPRLSVHRTLRHIYAQIIDDKTGTTVVSASDVSLKLDGSKAESAEKVGTKIAELAKEKKVTAVRFDRGSRRFHGRIAALADAARKAGLKF